MIFILVDRFLFFTRVLMSENFLQFYSFLARTGILSSFIYFILFHCEAIYSIFVFFLKTKYTLRIVITAQDKLIFFTLYVRTEIYQNIFKDNSETVRSMDGD